MNVSELIVKYLKKLGITHYFGYQGTMISYLVDAIGNEDGVHNHVSFNEQGASLAATGYTKLNGNLAVAYGTSGPGALNLLQGIADAYYDSVPVLFITGQLNLSEYTRFPFLRQQGFQQTDIVKICKPITKEAIFVENPDSIISVLDRALNIMLSGRRGPVLLDIPMDIQRAKVRDIDSLDFNSDTVCVLNTGDAGIAADVILNALRESKRPIFLLGNGISRNDETRSKLKSIINSCKIPVITTMLAKDFIETADDFNFGVVGYAYGQRFSNYIVNVKSDLIISLGARLCPRQIGMDSTEFAKNASIIRVDVDVEELARDIHKDDVKFRANVNEVIDKLAILLSEYERESDWLDVCKKIKRELLKVDKNANYRIPNDLIENLSDLILDNSIITCDVGQHQMWVMQSFKVRSNQKLLFSGGHGAMGFALPAAIGAYFNGKVNPVCIVGDGAFQMNIQELQWIVQENIPLKIIVLNNNSLGLIRQQQDSFFNMRYYGSTRLGGYSTPDFVSVAKAYGIDSVKYDASEILSNKYSGILHRKLNGCNAFLLEIKLGDDSYAYPKTRFGHAMHNQEPQIPGEIMSYIDSL